MKQGMMRFGVAAAMGLAFFVQQAQGAHTLIFIDNFTNNNSRVTSPLTTEPGSGTLGSTNSTANWWTWYQSSAMEEASHTEADGYLRLMARQTNSTTGLAYFRSSQYAELRYDNKASGEGLLLKFEDIQTDWEEGIGSIFLGLTTGGTLYACNNGIFARVHATNGFVDVWAKDTANTWPSDPLVIQEPGGTRRPKDVHLYVDGTDFSLTVIYDDDSQAFSGLQAHGLDSAKIANNQRLQFYMLPQEMDQDSIFLFNEVSVTQIPEPGSLALAAGALGVALLARRRLQHRG